MARHSEPELPMAPMVALFVLLVVFMIQFYAASGMTMDLPKDLALPKSSSTEIVEQAVKIEVTNDYVAVEGNNVASVAELNGTDLRIPGLIAFLTRHRERTEAISARNPNVQFEGKALLVGDKKVKYDTITRVMYSSGLAGFNQINMVVVQKQ